MSNPPHTPEKTVAEFFAGIGLMRIGLERAEHREEEDATTSCGGQSYTN